MSEFTNKVLDVVARIPKGSTLSYKEVAEKAGSPGACRAVGSILSKNADTSIPCHRVIKSNGAHGTYNGLLGSSKTSILESERS
jgi:methylated-DNA-[protein]-cysteine S-methyltransferase